MICLPRIDDGITGIWALQAGLWPPVNFILWSVRAVADLPGAADFKRSMLRQAILKRLSRRTIPFRDARSGGFTQVTGGVRPFVRRLGEANKKTASLLDGGFL